MPEVIYISAKGDETRVTIPSGMTLMHGALLNNIPGLLAECGGAMLCATCHCYVEAEWQNRITPASNKEREKLRKVHNQKPNSRLSCQIRVDDSLNGIRVQLPESQVWSN